MTFAPRFRRQAAVVLIALAGSLALAGCQQNAPIATEPTSQGSTVSTSEFSTLDAAGVEQIRASKTARLDMSSGQLRKADVRATGDSAGPEINTSDSGKIALTIVGPNGEIRGETDRIRLNTTSARTDFSEVTYFLTADSMDGFFSLVRDGVQLYGIDSGDAERWITSVSADPTAKSDYSLTSGTDTGLGVNYDLRFDGAKKTQVIIVHVSPAA
ncbi:hypothetical protein [Pseudarthrobacter sp. N5]|uniref:hypothetical protein n=1 Tax=Pseudarthrobacter sp. N5 TaxID=3418416 RepID=UPI003CFB0FAC